MNPFLGRENMMTLPMNKLFDAENLLLMSANLLYRVIHLRDEQRQILKGDIVAWQDAYRAYCETAILTPVKTDDIRKLLDMYDALLLQPVGLGRHEFTQS